jgi:Zn-dependent M16 (insulinase) family peptidase
MKGGAYGATSSFDPRTGVFAYGSAQDPNIVGTISAFDKAAGYLASVELSDAEITRGIIGAISDLDSYQLPDAKGHSALLRSLIGNTDKKRQATRDQVLSTSIDSFRKLADALQAGNLTGKIVVVGPPIAVAEAKKSVDFDVTAVL